MVPESEEEMDIEVNSPIPQRMSSTYGDKSKRNKNGLAKVYYCDHCNKIEHASKERIRAHKERKCEVRRENKRLEKEKQRNIESARFIQEQQTMQIMKKERSQ